MLTSDPLDHALRRLTHVDEHPELVGDDLREAARRLQRRDLAGRPSLQFQPPCPGDAAGAQAQAAPESTDASAVIAAATSSSEAAGPSRRKRLLSTMVSSDENRTREFNLKTVLINFQLTGFRADISGLAA